MSIETSRSATKKPLHSAETWKKIPLSTLPKSFVFYPLAIPSFLFAAAAGNDAPQWMGLPSLSFKLVGQQMLQIVSASGNPVPPPPNLPSSGR